MRKKTVLTPELLPLVIGQFISSWGEWIFDFFILIYVYDKTTSPMMVALLTIVQVAPNVALSPAAGIYVDRHERTRILFLTDLIRGAAILGILFFDNIAVIFWLILLKSTVSVFFDPARISYITEASDEASLLTTNSAFSFIYTSTMALGPLTAGFLYGRFRMEWLVLFVALTYFISAATSLKLPKAVKENQNEFPDARPSFISELKNGLSYLGRDRRIQRVFLVSAGLIFAIGVFNIVEMIYCQSVLNLTDEQIGFLYSCDGVGLALGAWLIGMNRIRLKNTLLFGGILLAINFFALAVFRNYIVVIIGNLAGGIGNTFILTGSQTLVQLFSPKEDIGKIISLRYTVHGLFSLIASFLGGIALSRVGSVPLLIFLGILAAGISLLSVGMDGAGRDAVAADF